MVVIKHQILLGQEIQVKRSDGTWHDAIITEIVVAHPEKFWEFPQASDHIKVIFADRCTKSILLQQELDDVLRPVSDIAGLIRCRREELFKRLVPEDDDIGELPDIELSQPDSELSQPRDLKRKTGNCQPTDDERHVRPRPLPKIITRPPVPVFPPDIPKCMIDDDDDELDDTFHEACLIAERNARQATSSSDQGRRIVEHAD